MKIYVVGTGIANRTDLTENAEVFQSNPAFRKATLNMKLSHLAASRAIEEAKLRPTDFASAAFVLGSSYGELTQTKEFLKSWAKERMARPLLFQSSLHNGTLGFLSLELGLKGPSFTVSHQYFTAEKALELGMDLLRDGLAELCLVSTVEVMDPELHASLVYRIPKLANWQDGAASVILASEAWAKWNGNSSFSEITEIVYQNNGARFSGPYYDSDGLEKFVLEIRKPNASAGQVQLLKLDGQEAIIKWKIPS